MSQIFATQLPNASGEPASVTERSDDPGKVSDGIYYKVRQNILKIKRENNFF